MNRLMRMPSRALPLQLAALCLLLPLALCLLGPVPVLAQDGGTEVYGLQGSLRQAVAQPFTTYLVVESDGRTFGLYGRTPQIDQQIEQYRQQNANVKVWGILYPNGMLSSLPEIVVDSITATTIPAAPTPTPVTAGSVTISVSGQTVNIRGGPGTNYPAIGSAAPGTVCTATGRNSDGSWLLVTCPGITGWVSVSVVQVTGPVVNLPVIAVGPPPTPQPQQFPRWKGSYYTNRDLAGAPSLIVPIEVLDYSWGYGSPSPGIPADNFSARFERVFTLNPDSYVITLRVDDGVRVWVNNQLVLDDWRVGSVRNLYVERQLSGPTPIVVEYFEATELASITFYIELSVNRPIPTRQPTPSELSPQSDQWAAAYWNNRDLTGAPSLARYESRQSSPLDRNWGSGSPAPGVIAVDNWSARWQGVFNFAAGDHVFKAISDDGIRVKIDGIMLIDAWYDGHKELSNTFRRLGSGPHTITIEFYENAGSAYATVSWYRDQGSGGSSGGLPSRDE